MRLRRTRAHEKSGISWTTYRIELFSGEQGRFDKGSQRGSRLPQGQRGSHARGAFTSSLHHLSSPLHQWSPEPALVLMFSSLASGGRGGSSPACPLLLLA